MKIIDGINKKDGNVKSFLMAGQSNMAGRGNLSDVPLINNERCFMLRNGRWQKMLEPVNTDRAVGGVKTVSGVSLAAAFADALACESGEEIGLIPCADGGTGIRQWLPGEVLFDHAVMQTRLAMRSSALCGILWHQGEADCYNMTDDEYAAHFLTVMRGFREALENPSLPIVIGELAWEFGENYPSLTAAAPGFNKLLSRLSKELPRCAIASAEGLTLKPDGLHFDAASLRVFGQRYLEKYYELI